MEMNKKMWCNFGYCVGNLCYDNSSVSNLETVQKQYGLSEADCLALWNGEEVAISECESIYMMD